MFEEEEASKKYGNIFIEQEARDYLSQHPSDIQGGQFGPLPLSKQTLGTWNKQGKSPPSAEILQASFFSRKPLETGSLAELLKSRLWLTAVVSLANQIIWTVLKRNVIGLF